MKPTNLTDCLSGHVTTGWNNGQIGKIDLRNFYNFQVGRTYKVKLTVDNIYAELNDKGETIPPCPPSDVHVECVTISKCIEGPIGGSVMGMSAIVDNL